MLDIRDVSVRFVRARSVMSWMMRRPESAVEAVSHVSLSIAPGETVGLVGESGSGKTTLGRAVLQLHSVANGEIMYRGKSIHDPMPVWQEQLRREVQMVFQDPYSSLNPRMTVVQTLAEVLRFHTVVPREQVAHEVRRLMEIVGLPASLAKRLPRSMSGGQRQRVGLARALAVRPSLLVLDEPVAALDVSIQAQILNLLDDLRHELNLAMLFIAHDLSVVRHVSDRVAVMYRGRIVEIGKRAELYAAPAHPYTRMLLAAVPRVGTGKRVRNVQPDVELSTPTDGCAFAPRCSMVNTKCRTGAPPTVQLSESHLALCHFATPT